MKSSGPPGTAKRLQGLVGAHQLAAEGQVLSWKGGLVRGAWASAHAASPLPGGRGQRLVSGVSWENREALVLSLVENYKECLLLLCLFFSFGLL